MTENKTWTEPGNRHGAISGCVRVNRILTRYTFSRLGLTAVTECPIDASSWSNLLAPFTDWKFRTFVSCFDKLSRKLSPANKQTLFHFEPSLCSRHCIEYVWKTDLVQLWGITPLIRHFWALLIPLLIYFASRKKTGRKVSNLCSNPYKN